LNSDWVRISLCVSLGSHRYGTLEGNLAYVPVMNPGFGSWHYDSWTWAKPNRAFCGDARAEWIPLEGGAAVRRQPHLTLHGMFVQPFSFVSYYFLELNLMISFLIFRRHIIADWGRDTGTILRPTQISIRICG
jgi:hypothetical protein